MSQRRRFVPVAWIFAVAFILLAGNPVRAQDAALDGDSDVADAAAANGDATDATDVAVATDATVDAAGGGDVGVPRDGGSDASADAAGDAGPRDAGSDGPPRVPPLDVGDDDGCSYTAARPANAGKVVGLTFLGILVIARRHRRC